MPPTILHIAVPCPLYQCFDYRAPDPVPSLQPGMRVQVPFGKRQDIGVLLELRDSTSIPEHRLRPVLAVLDREPVLPPELLALARFAATYYHHPPGEVYATLLPRLLRQGRPAVATTVTCWQLTAAGRTALAEDRGLRRAPRQRALLDYLAQQREPVSEAQVQRDLTDGRARLCTLQAKGWVTVAVPAMPTPLRTSTVPELNSDQQTAVAAVTKALDGFGAFLLDGVTGSGKTEVYLRIIEQVLARGRQALVLVPEIGLTPQLLTRFTARLPVPPAVLHSGLTAQERLNAWLAASSGQAGVVIGTRSALFTPLPHPGVIIVDEEHDASFKQQDGFRYHARDLAIVRAHQTGIPVLLGSATPSLESLHNAQSGRYHHLRLPERVGGALTPLIEVLDVRRQPLMEGLSPLLLDRIRDHLAQAGQVLLFLNRRGYAPTLICHECGWLSQCPHCDARLTLHLGRRQLICHHCGETQPVRRDCPGCGSVDLRALGQGTERIEQALQQTFPNVGIARMDRDSTRRKGSLQTLLDEIHDGRRRLLIGTQMLAKGHHFPDVTLVGIVDADQGLFGTDFRASERMAQLITQVAGRAGRAEKPGVVLIQTHHPHHPLLQTLVLQGYPAFAAAALAERRAAELPPFTWQALLRAEAKVAALAPAFLREAKALGQAREAAVELLGPVPAPMERRAGYYRAQLLVQASERPALHRFLADWVAQLGTLPGARPVRWSLDVDPQDLL